MIAVRLFGGLALELDGRPAPLPGRLHARLLLAYLALHPGPHARADLAGLLWPRMPPGSARANLRSAVASLRRAVGDHLDASRERVALVDAQVDALAAREALRAGRFDEGLALASGVLLQGLDAPWVEGERQEFLGMADQAAAALASRAEAAGDLPAAIGYARRRAAHDPLSEPPQRELMRLLAAAGDRASALVVYGRLSERLQVELRVAPSPETRALAARLRDEPEREDPLSLPAALSRAAGAAARVNAHADAAALYERASALLEHSVSSALRTRCEMLIGLGESRLRAGEPDGVREPLLEAARIAGRMGDPTLLAAAALGLSSVPFFPGDEAVDRTVLEVLGEALELTPRADAAGRARLLARIARERYFVAGEGEFERLAVEALALARSSGDAAALGAALDTLHLALAGTSDADRRLALADEMIRLGERTERAELCLRGHVLRGVDRLTTGDPDAAAREGAALESLSARVHQPAYRWWPALWRATSAIAADRLDDGARLADEAYAVGATPLGELAAVELASQRLWLAFRRGTLGEVAGDADHLAGRYADLPVLRAAQALAHAHAGDTAHARAVVGDLARSGFAALRRDPSWLVGAALVAQACAVTLDTTHADALRRALGASRSCHAVTVHGSVWLGRVSDWLEPAVAPAPAARTPG